MIKNTNSKCHETGTACPSDMHKKMILTWKNCDLVVLLDPFAGGRNAVLHNEDDVVGRRGDVVVGTRCDLDGVASSYLHRRRGLELNGSLPLRKRVRGEGRRVLEHFHCACSRRHLERYCKHLVVFQRPWQASDRWSHRIVTAHQPHIISANLRKQFPPKHDVTNIVTNACQSSRDCNCLRMSANNDGAPHKCLQA